MVTPGSRLGTHEVQSRLGAGGVGEVWRARDTHLGREVALKVLPDDVAHDPERRRRFEREARLLAALNHPGIASLYGLEQADGILFLVMELVEGRTLAEQLLPGPVPVARAIATRGRSPKRWRRPTSASCTATSSRRTSTSLPKDA